MATDRLECLDIDLSQADDSLLAQALNFIGQLTALTRLELHAFPFSPTRVAPHHDIANPALDLASVCALPLHKLARLHCYNLELGVIVPGALTCLRKLHVMEDQERQESVSADPVVREQLGACGRILLVMTNLSQLSSSCEMCSSGMGNELAVWRKYDYMPDMMTKHIGKGLAQLHIWWRP